MKVENLQGTEWRLYATHGEEALALRELVGHFIDAAMRAIDPEDCSSDLVWKKILERRAQLWLIYRPEEFASAACVLEVCTSGYLRVIGLGGSGWDSFGPVLLNAARRYAKEEGLKGIEVVGRKGWVRKLPSFKIAYVVLREKVI